MKNFSAKNAEFETLKINNEAAISSADLGTAPNQIPLNKDLGSLAYQDAVNLDDVSADMLELRAIAAEISDSAVDVFVYDTSRDSDGGAWRKRTSHTSWYNEELNTATRGGRREFPAVAVIVAEGGDVKKLKIYDGDDPDLPLWMSFEASGLGSALGRSSNAIFGISSIYMLNGLLCVTGLGDGNNIETLCQISFIDDVFWQWHTYGFGDAGISERNEPHSFLRWYRGRTDEPISTHSYHDVAMTILPNAPIDENTGLPVPTIAVATDGGVSVIKDDGTVVDITVSNSLYSYAKNVNFTTSNDFITVIGGSSSHDYIFVFDGIPNSDNVMTIDSRIGSSQDARSMFRKNYIADSTVFDGFTIGNGGSQSQMIQTIQGDRFACGNNYDGLTIIDDNNLGFQKKDLVYISSKYNTGWMCGDIKLATLSDTTAETIGESSDQLVVDGSGNWVGDFNATADLDSWEDQSTGTQSVDSSNVDTANNTITLTRLVSDSEQISKLLNLIEGQTYNLTFEITSATQDKGQIWIGTDLPSNNQTTGDIQTANEILNTGNILGVGLYSYVFKAKDVNYLTIRAGGDGTMTFKDISVRATTELITNGDFSTDSDWNKSDLWTISSETAVMPSTSQYKPLYQYDLNMIPGKKYVATIDVSAITGEIKFDTAKIDGLGISEADGIIISSTGTHSLTFAAESDQDGIGVARHSSPASCTVNSISVRPAEEDRSLNNNGLQIVGEINKTPVAPGADLVAYSGFSANNYLVQPYNEDLNFGTGDFCVMGWVNLNDEAHLICSLASYDGASYTNNYGIQIHKNGGGTLNWRCTTDNFASTKSVSRSIPLNTWVFVVGTISGGMLRLYINGVDAGHLQTNLYDFNNPEAVLNVGNSHSGGSNNENTKISLLRITSTTPTPDQIAKIYRDEKVLFQDGAQATLYGSSDAVTALAYDDSNQLLHVGTASGRSDFRGLARINNTTTAISNSISAAEGTIIQN